jgi:glycosyltransferase involved in cell wall biosynthesis
VDITLRAFLLPLLLTLKRAGFDLRAVCSPGPPFAELEAADIAVHRIPTTRRITPLRDLVSLWRLFRYFRHEKIDLVHAHTPKAGLLARLAARLAGVPVIVYTVHGFYFHDDSPWLQRHFYILMEKIGARCGRMLLPVSSEDVRAAVDLNIAPPTKIRHLGGGIDLDRFRPDRLSPDDIRRRRAEFNIPPDAVVVGIVARMVREKGYLELFQALAKLMPNFPKLYLLQIGGTDHAKPDALGPDSAKPYGITERSRLLGDRSDVPDLLLLMDILALPSFREGLPVSLMEASACGLPIVATRVRGCREVVVDGETGLLVPPRDADALADALEKLIASPPLREQMGQAGRRRVVQNYDQRRVFRTVLETYRDLLLERRLQPPAGLQAQLELLPGNPL